MTSLTKRIGYFLQGLGLVFAAMFCAFLNYMIGTIRISLLEGKKVKINFREFFYRPSLDEVLTKYEFDNLDVEAWRADRVVM